MRFSTPWILSFVLIVIGSACQAQLSYGGTAYGKHGEKLGLPKAPEMSFPTVDADQLRAEDEAKAAAGIKGPSRFGYTYETSITTEQNGLWHTMPNGDRVWRIALKCPGALSINLIFTRYIVPQGAHVFLYNGAGEVKGGFTAASNPGHQVLGVAPLRGQRITVEYVEPAGVVGSGALTIGQVIHGYRDPYGSMMKDYGDSQPCNVNVVCPEGDNWRREIRAVARVIEGGGYCSGTLLNDCEHDTIPYFLTANHCLEGPPPAGWVFQFNWESPLCDNTQPLIEDQTVSGSDQLANNPGSDMCFLRLSSRPPLEFNCYYAGWDGSGVQPDTVTCIHHPMGDIKKISWETDPGGQENIDVGNGPADCWHIQSWDLGTTQPGSSGSGLWNEHHQIIGQLYGGQADCSNNVNDYFGRFDVSYPFIQEWLGTCADTIGGYDPLAGPSLSNDGAITSIYNVPASLCDEGTIQPTVTLKNNGTAVLSEVTINYHILNGPLGSLPWAGTLLPLQTANVELPVIPISDGPHTLQVYTTQPNNQGDGNTADDSLSVDLVVNNPGELLQLTLALDQLGSETQWELTNTDATVLYSGGPYLDTDSGYVVDVPLCLGNACYIFTITDDFGDGICCGPYGNGNYHIDDQLGAMYVESDGAYGEGETRIFCVEHASVPEIAGSFAARVWPVPAGEQVNVEWSASATGLVNVTLADALGQEVYAKDRIAPQGTLAIPTAQLAEGAYVLTIHNGRGGVPYRLVVSH